MVNVTADQLKKTGLTQDDYMKAWNRTGKRPTGPTKPTTTAKNRDKVLREVAGPKKPSAAQLRTAVDQRAVARSNRLAPPAPPVPLTAAQRAAAEGRRRNLIQQASAQGFSKGGVIKKSKTRKKSNIDGIARRGHTRAPHK